MINKIEAAIADWHVVSTNNEFYSNENMLVWALKNCQGKFYHRGNKFWFHDKKDATIFALKYADYLGEPRVTFSP